MWRNEYRKCACGNTFKPRREAQRHCSAKCGTKARVTQHRSRYKESDLTEVPEKPLQAPQTQSGALADGPTMVWLRDFHHGPTPEALQGDDYPLEYYEDGYPKLRRVLIVEACLSHLRTRHNAPGTTCNQCDRGGWARD